MKIAITIIILITIAILFDIASRSIDVGRVILDRATTIERMTK